MTIENGYFPLFTVESAPLTSLDMEFIPFRVFTQSGAMLGALVPNEHQKKENERNQEKRFLSL
jgi:hypothetical protein